MYFSRGRLGPAPGVPGVYLYVATGLSGPWEFVKVGALALTPSPRPSLAASMGVGWAVLGVGHFPLAQ